MLTRAYPLAAALLVAAALALASPLAAAAAPGALPDAATPEELCAALTPAATDAALSNDPNLEFAAAREFRSTAVDATAYSLGADQLICRWYYPASDVPPFAFGFAAITAESATEVQDALAAVGYSATETAAGMQYVFDGTAPDGDPLFAEWLSSEQHLFIDGWWVRSSDPTLFAGLVEALQPAPEEPAEPEPTSGPPVVFRSIGIDTPSVFSGLPTIQEIQPTATGVTALAVSTIVFVAILAWPGKLLETAIASRWRSLTAPLAPAARLRSRLTDAMARLPRAAAITLGVLVAAVITGFLDPDFGSAPWSARLVVTQALALGIESVVGMLLVASLLRRREPGLAPRLSLNLGSLVLVALAVLFSRLAGFEPGLVFGVLLGLVYASALSLRRQRESAALELGYLLALGLLAWGVYSVLVAAGADGLIGVAAIELFAGLTVSCLSALPILLLPWRGLPGGTLFEAHRGVWAGSYAVASLAFLLVLVPFPSSWAEVSTPLVVWLVVYLVYALIAVGGWWALQRWVPADDDDVPPPNGRVRPEAARR